MGGNTRRSKWNDNTICGGVNLHTTISEKNQTPPKLPLTPNRAKSEAFVADTGDLQMAHNFMRFYLQDLRSVWWFKPFLGVG